MHPELDLIPESKDNSTVQSATALDSLSAELSKVSSGFSVTRLLKQYFSRMMKELGFKESKKPTKSVQNPDGSVTHEFWFAYESPKGKFYQVPFYINGRPLDEEKRSVSLSYKYISPEDLLNDKIPKNDSDWKIKENVSTVKNNRDDIFRALETFLKQEYGDTMKHVEEFDEEIESNASIVGSRQLQVTLSKVSSSTGQDIHMTSIRASYNASDVISDLNILLQDENFVNDLECDHPTQFSIDVDDDGLDVCEITDEPSEEYFKKCRLDSYAAILDSAYFLYLDNQFMGYVASGSRMSDIQNYVMNYSWRTLEIIDAVSQMILEEGFSLEHPIYRIQHLMIPQECQCIERSSISWDEFVIRITRDIQSLLNNLTLYSCNFSADKQNQIQGWIRTWSHEIDYVLTRSNALDF